MLKEQLLAIIRKMNLSDIYMEGGYEALKKLAESAGTNPQYLRQCATRWRGKKPSPALAIRLIAAEPRLKLDDIYRGNESAVRSNAAT